MKLSASEFKNSNHKCLTLLGMSGVGKTHLAKLLNHQHKYFHYSGDYRIGAEYLNDKILDNIKKDPSAALRNKVSLTTSSKLWIVTKAMLGRS